MELQLQGKCHCLCQDMPGSKRTLKSRVHPQLFTLEMSFFFFKTCQVFFFFLKRDVTNIDWKASRYLQGENFLGVALIFGVTAVPGALICDDGREEDSFCRAF